MYITGAWGAWRNTRIKKKLLLLVTGVHAPSFFFAKKKTAAAGCRDPFERMDESFLVVFFPKFFVEFVLNNNQTGVPDCPCRRAGSRPTPLVPVVVNCGGHRVTARTPPRRLGPLPAAATLSALGLQDGCG